jgi:hypothetical protein
MFWSFIIALTVATAPGVEVTVKTHRASALLVMIRDVALSEIMLTLYNFGLGRLGVEKRIFGHSAFNQKTEWDSLELLLRLSLESESSFVRSLWLTLIFFSKSTKIPS